MAKRGAKARTQLGNPANTDGRALHNVRSPATPLKDKPGQILKSGIVTTDTDNAVVFVQAEVAAVSLALAKLLRAKSRDEDVANREIELSRDCCFVTRLAGQTWTMVIHNQIRVDYASQARELSKRLDTLALSYQVSDTAGAIGYELYEQGQLLEKFEDSDLGMEFRSALRDDEPTDPYEFADQVFREQGILDPATSFAHVVGYVASQPGDKVTIRVPKKGPVLIERIDFLKLPRDDKASPFAAMMDEHRQKVERAQAAEDPPARRKTAKTKTRKK